MFSKAYIHEYGNGKIEPEHQMVKEVLDQMGIPCKLFTYKRLSRNQIKIDKETLVVGDNAVIYSVLKKIGYRKIFESYPKCLREYLYRDVWEIKLGTLIKNAQTEEIGNIFIKPKNKAKLFTGFILNTSSQLFNLDVSRKTVLYCAPVVDWVSEYRIFVNKGKIVGIQHYDGNPAVKLNTQKVEEALEIFENSEEKTDAYGIDFGVLKGGKTALVEWNDGFALGSYGLDQKLYTDLLMSRWSEIVGNL
ncbi:MAG: ATP-grasp domain-containing protein [Flavobacteriales bacterium]|nr:ATP-grasp domain-containing protein [Flavobacteriales bacterium]